jgi:hypothetical protein
MAMTPEGMANAIYAKMAAEYWPDTSLPSQAESETKRYYKTLSEAIIDYVGINCDVNPGSFYVPSVGNVAGQGKLA